MLSFRSPTLQVISSTPLRRSVPMSIEDSDNFRRISSFPPRSWMSTTIGFAPRLALTNKIDPTSASRRSRAFVPVRWTELVGCLEAMGRLKNARTGMFEPSVSGASDTRLMWRP